MSGGTESVNSSGHSHDLVHRMSRVSINIAPFARPRKISRSVSTVSSAAYTSPRITSPPENGGILTRKTSKASVLKRQTSFQTTPIKNGSVAGSKTSGNNNALMSPTETNTTKSALPVLNESRRMNLTDVVIWRRFTRALRQRVEEKKTEKRTFCWLDMSSYGGDGRRQISLEQMEPTYQLEPTTKLQQTKCKEMINEYLQNKLKNTKYESYACGEMSKEISNEIRAKVKGDDLLPPRYKCIVYVVFGEKKDQAIRVTSMSAWDKNTDCFVSCNYQNNSVFCVVTLFAVYME